MKAKFLWDNVSKGYVGVPVVDDQLLPLCAQGETLDELEKDLKFQVIEVMKIIISELESGKEKIEFTECKTSEEFHNT